MDKKGDRLVHWTDRKIESIYKMRLLGMSEVDMAEVLEVSYEMFKYWKKTRPEVTKALNDAKLGASTSVAEAFLLCAIGYDYDEEIAVYDRSSHEWKKTTIKRHRPADPWSAAKFLSLKNRNEGWSETQRVQIDYNANLNIDMVTTMSTELLAILEKEAKKLNTPDNQISLPEDAGDDQH